MHGGGLGGFLPQVYLEETAILAHEQSQNEQQMLAEVREDARALRVMVNNGWVQTTHGQSQLLAGGGRSCNRPTSVQRHHPPTGSLTASLDDAWHARSAM